MLYKRSLLIIYFIYSGVYVLIPYSQFILPPFGNHILSGSGGKESSCSAGDIEDAGSILESGRLPEGGKWQPTLVFLLEKCHGLRSLVGYSLWHCKEVDTTEQLTLTLNTVFLPVHSRSTSTSE